MNYPEERTPEMPLFMKAIVMLIVGVFVIIGLIGLILPIIPGILFLALAAWLMAKVSSRFASHLDESEIWQKVKDYWSSVSFLTVGQQVKLTLLLVAKTAMDAVKSLVEFIKKQK